jgi:hypothetical protein
MLSAAQRLRAGFVGESVPNAKPNVSAGPARLVLLGQGHARQALPQFGDSLPWMVPDARSSGNSFSHSLFLSGPIKVRPVARQGRVASNDRLIGWSFNCLLWGSVRQMQQIFQTVLNFLHSMACR